MMDVVGDHDLPSKNQRSRAIGGTRSSIWLGRFSSGLQTIQLVEHLHECDGLHVSDEQRTSSRRISRRSSSRTECDGAAIPRNGNWRRHPPRGMSSERRRMTRRVCGSRVYRSTDALGHENKKSRFREL